MNWVIKHRGIIVALFAVMLVSTTLAISGVFGSTQIGIALFSNPDLENGLVGHWTLDDIDPDSGTTTDRTGNGNEGIFITGGGSGAVAGPGDYIIRRNNASTTEITSAGQIAGWDTEVATNGTSISYSDGTFTLASGKYLVMWSERLDADNATLANNLRTEVQGYIYLNGSATTTGMGSVYHRNSDTGGGSCAGLDCQFENVLNGAGILNIASDDTTLYTHLLRTDDEENQPPQQTVNRVSGWGGITILRLDDSWDYARYSLNADTIPVDAFGTLPWNSTDEEDTGFSRSGGNITITDAGRYLVSYSVPIRASAGARTSFTARLATSTGEIAGTRINAYIRNSDSADDGNLSWIGVVDLQSSDVLEVETDMTDGTLTSNNMLEGSSIQILKLPAGNETFILGATSGDINQSAVTEFTWANTAHIDTAGFRDTSPTDTIIEPEVAGDYLFFASAFGAGGNRLAPTGRFSVNDTIITHGAGGQFIRNATVDGGYSWGTMLTGLAQYDDISLETLGIAELNTSAACEQCSMSGIRMDSLFTPSGGDTDATSSKARPGKIGQGLVFDGSDDIILIEDDAALDYSGFSGATWAAWIKADQLASTIGDGMTFMSHYNGVAGNRTYYFFIDQATDQIQMATNNGDGLVASTEAISTNQWYHVTATWSGSNYLRLYVDGEFIAEDSSVEATLDGNTEAHYIGARGLSPVDEWFDGLVDDVRIYDRALSANEVQRLYELGATTKIGNTLTSNTELETNLVKHITFDGDYEVGTYEFATQGVTTTDLTSSVDQPGEIIVGDDGYIYASVSCNGCGSFGSLASVTYKVDPSDGSMLWATTTDSSSGSDRPNDIFVGNDGHVYVAAYCAACGPQGGSAYTTLKIDSSNGDLLWATTTDPTTGDDIPSAMVVDDNGFIYVSGYCNACGNFGSTALYTIKIHPDDGTMLWATTTDPTSANDFPEGITADSDGYVYVAGRCPGCGGLGLDAHYTFKVDSDDGTMLWATTTDITSSSERPRDVVADDAGSIYITGGCSGCGPQSATAQYTYKVSTSDGSMVWATTTDFTSSNDEGYSIALGYDGYLYTLGECTGCGDEGNIAHTNMKIDPSDGSVIWGTTTDPTSNNDIARGNSVGLDGYVYVIGDCNGCGTAGNSAIYMYKTDPSDGTLVELTSSNAVIALSGVESVAGNIGQGIEFDGVDDYIHIENDSGAIDLSDAFTVGAWIYFDTLPLELGSDAMIYTSGVGSDGYWQFVIDDVDNRMGFKTDAGSLQQARQALRANEWYHVLVKKDSGSPNISYYLNGLFETSDDIGSSSPTAIGDHQIGARVEPADNPRDFFPFTIDDVRVYDASLATSTILKIYQLGATTHIGTSIKSNPDLESGLLLHATFDGKHVDLGDTAAEILDASGNGATGNMQNFSSTDDGFTPGKIGQAIHISKDDSGDDYVDFGSDVGYEGLSAATWSVWAKHRNGDSQGEYIVSDHPGAGGNVFNIEYASGEQVYCQLNADTEVTSYFANGGTAMDDTDWHHYVCVYDGSNLTVYFDGEQTDQNALTGIIDATTEELRIGNNIVDSAWYGRVDDLRVYNRALDASEVTRLYELGN